MSVAATLTLASCSGGGASPAALAGSYQACPTCTVQVTQVMTVGSEHDSLIPDDATDVVRLENGEFVAIAAGGDRLLRYGADGKYVSSLGVPGDGPGELRGVFELYRLGNIVVASRRDGRAIEYAPAGDLVSEHVTPPRCRRATVEAEVLCVGFHPEPTGEAGLPFHVLTLAGGRLRSFGPTGRGNPAFCPLCRSTASLTNGPDPVLVAAEWPRYRVEWWRLSGERVGGFALDSVPFEDFRIADGPQGPAGMPMVSGVMHATGDTAWVLRSVDTSSTHYELMMSGRWTPGAVSGADQEGTTISLVDVVVAGTGRLQGTTIAGRRFRPLGDGLAWSREYTPSGAVTIGIWRLELTRP